MVVANDVEYKRCHLMMHQVKRLQSPLCVVLNHDATVFPNVLLPRDRASPPPASPPAKEVPALDVLQYDRVLCDVPCSGDGTLRKNGDLWERWSPWMALSLHRYVTRTILRITVPVPSAANTLALVSTNRFFSYLIRII